MLKLSIKGQAFNLLFPNRKAERRSIPCLLSADLSNQRQSEKLMEAKVTNGLANWQFILWDMT